MRLFCVKGKDFYLIGEYSGFNISTTRVLSLVQVTRVAIQMPNRILHVEILLEHLENCIFYPSIFKV